MWIALFKSESCDNYVLGPFEKKPTQDELYQLFKRDYEEEAEYSIDELGIQFKIIRMSKRPEVINLQTTKKDIEDE